MTWIIISIIVLTLVLSAMFSGMEIAFISAAKLNVEIRKNTGSKRGNIIARFYDNPKRFLSTMLVGNNIALVLFSFLLEMLLKPIIEPYMPSWLPHNFATVLPLTLITTVVVLVFGEFLPKLFFRIFADKVLFSLAYPVAFFKWLFSPISWIMVKLAEQFLKLFIKTPLEETEAAFTRVDLVEYLKSTGIAGDDNEIIDTEMFSNVLDMKTTRVRKLIVPRKEIKAVDINDSVEDLIDLFIETNLSKIIVYNESIDDIIGYVHHQSILKKPKSIQAAMRKIYFAPGAMKIHDLMNTFIRNRSSIACVLDEFGGTSGIITLEDILEEIFGDIEDEHDVEEEYLEEKVSDTEYRFSGRLEIDYLNEKYPNLHLPEGEYSTLSGYIVMTKGIVPEQDQIIVMENLKFHLEMVSNIKIETIRVTVLNSDENE